MTIIAFSRFFSNARSSRAALFCSKNEDLCDSAPVNISLFFVPITCEPKWDIKVSLVYAVLIKLAELSYENAIKRWADNKVICENSRGKYVNKIFNNRQQQSVIDSSPLVN